MKLHKKIAAAVITLVMVLSMSVSSFAALVYDGTADLPNVPSGNADYGEWAGAGRLGWAGEPSFAYNADNGLFISGRTANWNAVDLLLHELPAGTYTLEVEFSTPGTEAFWIQDADGPYGILASSDKGSSATLSYEFEVDDSSLAHGQNRIRLNTEGTSDYFIKSVMLYDDKEEAAPAAGGEDNPQTGDNDIIFFAIISLAIAAFGAFVFYRKAKTE
jgi:LPXTG-motif cell wall-anchored protein